MSPNTPPRWADVLLNWTYVVALLALVLDLFIWGR